MKKRGTGLPFNVLIVAIIALVVLIVMIAVYTGFIGKIFDGVDEPTNAITEQATDVAWCISEVLKGSKCEELDSSSCSSGCSAADPVKSGTNCKLTCTGEGMKRHAIAMGSEDRDYSCDPIDKAARFCCCS